MRIGGTKINGWKSNSGVKIYKSVSLPFYLFLFTEHLVYTLKSTYCECNLQTYPVLEAPVLRLYYSKGIYSIKLLLKSCTMYMLPTTTTHQPREPWIHVHIFCWRPSWNLQLYDIYHLQIISLRRWWLSDMRYYLGYFGCDYQLRVYSVTKYTTNW